MRGGDFSATAIFPGQNIGTDPAGNGILNGAIYDPATRTTLPSGQLIVTPFPRNIIPPARFDPVALKIQNLIPLPTNANQTANYAQLVPTPNNQQTPTLKIDHVLPDTSRLSFYFNKLTTNQLTANDSLPQPVSTVRVQAIYGTIVRLNHDKSITPTRSRTAELWTSRLGRSLRLGMNWATFNKLHSAAINTSHTKVA